MVYTRIPLKEQSGFSLIELLAAMVIFCIGLLALLSCFGITVISNVSTARRADAVRVAQEQLEAVKGKQFNEILSKTEQIERNGVIYTCDIVVRESEAKPYLKDVAISVSWMSRPAAGGTKEQVQLATAVLSR